MNCFKKRFISMVVLSFIFLLNLSCYVYAIDNNINFNKITIQDGLSQTSVEAIFQDSEGYMWFGTADGLNRYDGKEFKIFRYKDNEKSIPSNYISSIIEDDYGNIWVGTSEGLSRINKRNWKIKTYRFNPNDPNSLCNYNVWDLLKDSKGRIWIGTENGLSIYDREEDNFKRFYHDKDDSNSLSNNFVTCLCEDKHGNVWIGTKVGLNKYDEKTNTFKRYLQGNDTNTINDDSIYGLCSDNDNLWIGTKKGGLNCLNLKNGEVTKHLHDEKNENSIPSNFVRTILKDNEGTIWIGTDKGISEYERKDNKFITFKNKIYDPQSIISDNILSLFQDASGMIWVGTYNGISNFNSKSLFKNYKRYYYDADEGAFGDNMVNGIYEDNEGLIWVGTNEGLISLNRNTKKTKLYVNNKVNNSNSNTISDNQIWGITGYKNEIWIGTANGLNKFDKSTGEFTSYFCDENDINTLPGDDVKYLYIDSKENLWIGTRTGLASFDRKSNFTNYNHIFTDNGIIDRCVTSIYEDSNGIMWFGCGINGGVIRYDPKDKSVKRYVNDSNNKNTITFNAIQCINGDTYGNIWIGTDHGLNKLNTKNNCITRYTEQQGLANNKIYGVLLDKKQNPWISTNGGISKLDINKERFLNFDVTDGLQSNEFDGYSYFKSKSGEMFFGGINGFNSFIPEDLVVNTYLPKVHIEDVVIKGKVMYYTKNIKLRYNENYILLNFFLPDFRNISKIQYSFKLDGFDKEWTFSDNRNYATYTNIPPGKYMFLVRARNSSGEWSEPTRLKIEIDSPPWKSPIAYAIYVAILLLVVYLIWNYVNILERLVKQRTEELNNKLKENDELYTKLIRNEKYRNNYFVNLSHELRTPLNVIISVVQLISNLNKKEEHIDKEKIDYYMSVLDGNSKRLIKFINNIIDTSKIESGTYKLVFKKVDIIYLVEEIALSMKDFIESNGIELIIDPEVEEKEIECDSGEIEKCVINLIGNAVKFTPEGGKIIIRIFDRGDEVDISVKDTGVGIDEKYHKTIFNRFSQAYKNASEEHGGSGLGLTLTNQLVNLHNGKITLKSKLGEGSEFIITLPVSQKDNKNAEDLD